MKRIETSAFGRHLAQVMLYSGFMTTPSDSFVNGLRGLSEVELCAVRVRLRFCLALVAARIAHQEQKLPPPPQLLPPDRRQRLDRN